MQQRPGTGRSVALLVLGGLVALQVALLVALWTHAAEQRTHEATVALSAPGGLAVPLAQDVDALPGRPFDAQPVASEDEARDQVRSRAALAGLVVDLRGTEDALVVSAATTPDVRRAVVAQAREVEAARGRTVTVEMLAAPTTSARVRAAALVACWGGFLLGCVPGRARWRIAGLLVLGGLAAAVTAPGVGPGALVLLVTAATAGVATLAARLLARIAGRWGLWLGALTSLVAGIGVVHALDPVLLGEPWSVAVRVTPAWATTALLDAAAGRHLSGVLTPLLVMTAWLAVVLAGLSVVRRHERIPAAGERWRGRTALALGAALAVTLAGALALPTPSTSTTAVASLASQTQCVATGTVDSLADLNRISRDVRADDSFQGGDVGADVALQDGRRLMVFGDTLRGAAAGERFVRNSMLVLGPDCIAAVLPADGGAVIPNRTVGSGPEVGYWPMSIGRVARPGYDLVAVGAQRVRTTGEGVFDFENLGPSVAVFVVPRGGTPQLVTVRDAGPDDADVTRPTWGAASAVSDGWLYLYGTARPGQEGVFGFSLGVARVRPDDVLDQDRWRYWDGERWQRDAASAAELVPALRGVSQTLSVFEQDGTWYALSKRDEALGTDVAVWRAPDPWGPFDDGTTVAELPSDAATGLLRYMPLAHPDLLPVPGTVVVSYSRNRTDVSELIEDPYQYRPRFLRVTLP